MSEPEIPESKVKKKTLSRLESELARMKKQFQSAQELKLERTPNNGPKSEGVMSRTIRIYEADEAKALDTLRHEFVEYVLMTELVAPYKRLVNKLILLFEEEMYDRKEKLIKKLQELIR